MASTVDTAIVRMGFDGSDVNKGISDTNRALQSLDSQIRKTGAGGSGLDRVQRDALKTANSLHELSGRLGSLQSILGSLSEAFTVGLTVPLALVGRAAFNAYRDLDNTQRGIAAVLGSTSAATRYIEQLRDLAKQPGLDFQSTTQGFRRLVAAGIDVGTATSALREFGNALALVGGNSEDMQGVALALQQIASKTKVSAEEINQMAERIPSIRRMILQAYGTADTEQLQKMGVMPKDFIKAIVREAQTLPRATSGVANEMKNIRDEIYKTLAQIGEDVATALLPFLKEAAQSVHDLSQAFKDLDPSTRQFIVKAGVLAAALGGLFYVMNTVRGVLKAGIDLYRMIVPAIVGEAAAVNASAAAYTRLAEAKVSAEVAGFAGAGVMPPAARGIKDIEATIANRREAISRMSGAAHAAMGALGTAGDAAMLIEREQGFLRIAEAELKAAKAALTMRERIVGALTGPAGIAAAVGVAVYAFGTMLLKSSNVADMNDQLTHKYDKLNQQLGLTPMVTGKVIDQYGNLVNAQDVLIGRSQATAASMEEINKKMKEQQALADVFYETRTVDSKFGRAIMHPDQNGDVGINVPRDTKDALMIGLGRGVLKPIKDPADIYKDEEAAKKAERLRQQRLDEFQKQAKSLAEAQLNYDIALNGGIINPVEKLRRQRGIDRDAEIASKGQAFGKASQMMFDLETEKLVATETKKMLDGVDKIIAQAHVSVKKELDDLSKEMSDSLDYNTKKLQDSIDENIKFTSTHYQTILNANLDSRQAANDAQQARDIEQIDMLTDASVKGQLSAEAQKLAITKEYAQKRLGIELQRIDASYVDEISKASDAEQLKLLMQQIDDKKKAVSDKVNADIEEASKDSAVRQAKIMRDEYLRQFDQVKDGAGRIFDALVTKTESFGDAIKAILKTALLTPLREFAATWSATLLMGGNPRSGQQSSGGGILSGIFGGIMNRGIGGGVIPGTTPATTPPFIPQMASAVPIPMILGGGRSAGGLGSMGNFGLPPVIMGGGGNASIWQATGLAQYGSMLSKLGNLGTGTGMIAKGTGGMTGGAMLLGGGILAADGLRRGGIGGMLETTAGGALIGFKFGGVAGAVIGGAIGLGAGFARLFKKSGEDKVREAIKNSFGVDIADKAILKQIWSTIKQSFGGNIAVGLQSKDIRELVQLYAASTGQTYRGPATEAMQTTLVQGGGSIYQTPGVSSLGTALPMFGGSIPMLGGVASAGSGYGQPVVLNIQLDGKSTESVMRGEAIQVIADNPRMIASSMADAASQNYDRRDTAITSLQPGLLTA